MRTLLKIHQAKYAPINHLKTYSALPSESLEHLDPFLLLNHHGPQVFPPSNYGLPFDKHPHRGIETVTFIISGSISHIDSSSGKESIIHEGGVQWMRAGRGITHVEQTSASFKKDGGELEILQLWLNLPSKYKMIDPKYIGLQQEKIPFLDFYEGKVKVNILSGSLLHKKGPFTPLTDIYLSIIHFKSGGKLELQAPTHHNILLYVIFGEIMVNKSEIKAYHLVEFDHDADNIQVEAISESTLLFGHALPFHEPIVSKGPFVMNSEEEIKQAFADYKEGRFY
jgi:quercetin 2,3-dioxygenase